MAALLLVVSPDATLRDVVQRSARLLGHEALAEPGSVEGRRALTRASIDVLCIDSVLPADDAATLCQTFRATASGREVRVVYVGPLAAKLIRATLPPSLREGIDAFIAKPIEPVALCIELKRIFEGLPSRQHRDDCLYVDGVTLDGVTRNVHFEDGATLALTPVEHKLLRCLMEQAGEYVSKPDLLQHVWGYPPDGGSELVRAHISNLRRKLRTLGREALLRTMPYHGYAFVPEVAP